MRDNEFFDLKLIGLILVVCNFGGKAMDFLDTLNLYLSNHPVMFDQLMLAFRIKFWLLLGLAIYFLLLPYRQRQKDIKKELELAKVKKDRFLA